MLRFPNCKINIGLQILNRRVDGFHNICTLFYPVRFLSDALEIVESNSTEDQYFITGIPIEEPIEKNICFKAVNLLRKFYHFPAIDLHLHKLVPMGAGLGGGSADATFTLMMINELFDLKISQTQLLNFASQLGSDCAFFVDSVPQIGEGKGEKLTPFNIDLSGKQLVIIKPNIHVSTADAYQNIIPNPNQINLQDSLNQDISNWKSTIVNDFEVSVFGKYSEIAKLKQSLYDAGAIYAQMSGSGAACYGIFDSKLNLFELPSGWSLYQGEI